MGCCLLRHLPRGGLYFGSAVRCAEKSEIHDIPLYENVFFVPLAVEKIGVLNQAYAELVKKLGRRPKARSGRRGAKRQTVWLAQRVSVLASPQLNRQTE